MGNKFDDLAATIDDAARKGDHPVPAIRKRLRCTRCSSGSCAPLLSPFCHRQAAGAQNALGSMCDNG